MTLHRSAVLQLYIHRLVEVELSRIQWQRTQTVCELEHLLGHLAELQDEPKEKFFLGYVTLLFIERSSKVNLSDDNLLSYCCV